MLRTEDQGKIPLVEAGVEAKRFRASADLAVEREADWRHQRVAGGEVQVEVAGIILDKLSERGEALGHPLLVDAAARALFLQQADLAMTIDDLGVVIDAENARDGLVRSR